ncbi:MAG TPA: chemotaxis protein CheA [Burkholderiales bacterium]
MAIDLSRFHSTFFEESLEGVASMETELLEMERQLRRGGKHAAENLDSERLNHIFRAAHSIKGGSGTFGFTQVADFAHALECLLDEARSGHRLLDANTVNLLLRGVDCLRALVHAAKDGAPPPSDVEALHAELEHAHAGAPTPSARPNAGRTESVWSIRFVPHDRFFHTGNDPLRVFRALVDLGPITTRSDTSRVPAWELFDPEACYLAWDVTVEKAIERGALDDVFAWVVGDCDLSIEAPSAFTSSPAAQAATKVEEKASSIRVATAKVDGLVDIVGELVITQTMLSQVVAEFTSEHAAQLRAGVAQLERHTRNLQDAVLGIRMLPLGFVFGRLPRLARDVATLLGKQVELEISGDRTELDKAIIERISDPLIHLVRNSIDHGIEMPQDRARGGKPAHGTIRLSAYHKAGNVVIEVSDDGRGLDRERILAKARERGLIAPDAVVDSAQIDEFIFMPGFSTSETVSDVSGRGVGLDVVRNNIRSLGGGVEVHSTVGQGTQFVIRLPLTLAIVDGMSLRVGDEVYILPLAWIAETLQVRPSGVTQPAGGPEIIAVRDDFVPLLRLDRVFNVVGRAKNLQEGLAVIVEADGKRIALFVDELLGQQQVVLKSLEPHCQRLEGISAATILGDGTVALILDAGSLVRQAHGAAAALAAASNTLHPNASSSASTIH